MSRRIHKGFQSCFPNMNELRRNVDKIGKQWVKRPIFCVAVLLCFLQNGENEGDRCQATPTSEQMHLRKRNAICFWKNPFCVSFLVLIKNYKVFFNVSKENLLVRETTLHLGDSTISYAFCSKFATFNVFRQDKFFKIKQTLQSHLRNRTLLIAISRKPSPMFWWHLILDLYLWIFNKLQETVLLASICKKRKR